MTMTQGFLLNPGFVLINARDWRLKFAECADTLDEADALLAYAAGEFHAVHKMPPYSFQLVTQCEHGLCRDIRAYLARRKGKV